MPFTFAVPDILFHEELEAQHAHLLRLELCELSGESVWHALELTAKYARASRNGSVGLWCPLGAFSTDDPGPGWRYRHAVAVVEPIFK
jgi:hypothetical protein